MRTIKFRAWDGGEMDHDVGFYNGKVLTGDGDDVWAWHQQPDVPLMQFTGLLDKNGVEIYEGDVLEHPRYYDTPEMSTNPPEHSAVIFKDGCFTFEGSDSLIAELDGYDGQMCVVGNIHQHPELLGAPTTTSTTTDSTEADPLNNLEGSDV